MTTADSLLQTLTAAGWTLIDATLPDRPPPVTVALDHVESLLRLPDPPKVAFIERIILSDETFILHPGAFFELLRTPSFRQEPYHDDLLGVPGDYDARTLNPDLTAFTRQVGEVVAVEVLVPYQGLTLQLAVTTDTWDTLQDALDALREQVEQHYEQALQAVRDRFAATIQQHEAALRALDQQDTFVALAAKRSTTQKALLSYARRAQPAAVAAIGETRAKELLYELAERLRTEA